MDTTFDSFSIEGLQAYLAEAGLPSFRTWQILDWVYVKGATSYDAMTNIPKAVREQFSSRFPLFVPEIVDLQESRDGTKKYLLRLHDDVVVESVGLPSDDGRLTVCCSSQAGCAMKCAFCATGQQGLTRNLVAGEIVNQVLTIQNDYGKRVTNVVVMGQGEPFANYDETMAALRIMNHKKLLNIGARHITVSTCGVIQGIRRLSEEPEQFTLAISLHAARQELRDVLMPAMRNQGLEELRDVLGRYTESTGRRFSFEYALIDGINDSPEDLDALVSYCRGLLCHVNLIPLNSIESSPFRPSPVKTINQWLSSLESCGIAASIRKSKGSDIAGACGQLANRM